MGASSCRMSPDASGWKPQAMRSSPAPGTARVAAILAFDLHNVALCFKFLARRLKVAYSELTAQAAHLSWCMARSLWISTACKWTFHSMHRVHVMSADSDHQQKRQSVRLVQKADCHMNADAFALGHVLTSSAAGTLPHQAGARCFQEPCTVSGRFWPLRCPLSAMSLLQSACHL